MTRCTAIRHTLSALAAVALVSGFVAGPASAQYDAQTNSMMNNNLEFLAIQTKVQNAAQKPDAKPKGLATQNPSQQAPTTHYQFRWWQDYGSR